MITNNRKRQNFFLMALFMIIIFISVGVSASLVITFNKPGGAVAVSNTCNIDGDESGDTSQCQLTCPLTNPACCDTSGQYTVNIDFEHESSTFDCAGGSPCSINNGYRYLTNVNAHDVDWDSDPADCSCKVGAGRWAIPFEAGLSPNCCGDDSNEYYSGPSAGNSCDGTEACCNSLSKYALGGSCVSACPSTTSAYFTDLIGNNITQTDVNDYVMMVAKTVNADGALINFSVKEAGAASCYVDNYSSYSNNGKASVMWKVKTCQDGTSDGNIFRAYPNILPGAYIESGLLAVGLSENDSLPVAIISTPLEGSMFNVGENVNFTSGSYDVDDPITSYQWKFDLYNPGGDTSNLANPLYAYPSGGPKFVELTVQNVRGKTASARIGILINSSADDPPLAVISEPRYGERFSGMLITFNATLSRDDVKPFNQLIFTWEFDDGTTYNETGMNGAYFTKLFSVAGEHDVKLTVDDSDPTSYIESLFYIRGCQVPLDGGYEFVPLGSCSSVSKHYFCVNETTYYDTMNEHCEGANGIATDSDDCCPRGFYCPSAGVACAERPTACENYNTSAECQLYGCIWLNGTCSDPASMMSCSDYKNQGACDSDILGLGKPVSRGLGTDICGRTFGDYLIPKDSCMCKWDSTTCRFSYGVNKTISGAGFITCMKSFSLTGCLAGSQTMNWTAACSDWSGGADCAKPEAIAQCASGQKEIKCGTVVSKMEFFDAINLIIDVAILAAYYIFILKKEARGHHKARRK